MTGYDQMTIWLMFFIVGIGTYALRLSFIILFGRLDDVPVWIEGVLRFVPPAALAALIVPAIISLSLEPSLGLMFEREKLLAGVIATLVAWRTKRVLPTIGIGMIALWGLQLVL